MSDVFAKAAMGKAVDAANVAKSLDLKMVNVKAMGAIGDGESHPASSTFSSLESLKAVYPKAMALSDEIDALAIQKAFDVAGGQRIGFTAGGTVYFPNGRYVCNIPLTADDVGVDADIQGTTLVFSELGEGVAAVTVSRTAGKRALWNNITITGPGTSPVAGVKTALCTGIKVVGSAMTMFSNMAIRNFGKGMDWASFSGHIKLFHTHIEYNWYGVYVSNNSGDYTITASSVNQNLFANFATHAGSGIEGLSVRDSHIGYAPYSFYCEPAPNPPGGANIFIKDLLLDHCRFEQVGNGAFFSDPSQGANPRVETIKIHQPGFSWGRDKGEWIELPNWPRDYAIDLGQVINGEIWIENDSYPFTAGNVNVMRIREQVNPSTVTILGTNAKDTDVVVDTGVRRVTAGTNVGVQQVGVDTTSMRQFSRPDRAGDYFEEDIVTDNTGVMWRLTRVKSGTRTELMTVNTNNEIHLKRGLYMDAFYINPPRLATVPANPREGSVYIDTSNTGYECVRTYLQGRWNRRGVGSTVPTAGSWQRSDYIENSAPAINAGVVIKGWLRITTGTANVLGTDWVEDKITVS